jgi:Protein of unknown function (DUF2924)
MRLRRIEDSLGEDFERRLGQSRWWRIHETEFTGCRGKRVRQSLPSQRVWHLLLTGHGASMEEVVSACRTRRERVHSIMNTSLYAEMERLRSMKLAELRERYCELYGEQATSAHRQHLVRRIAWRWQALQQGDISERARRRALEIANDADLKTQVPSRWAQALTVRRAAARNPRLPAIGSLLQREYRGRRIVVEVLADGFQYEGRRYGSLSAVAQAATGTHWNGLVFFGLAERKKQGPRDAR